MIHFLAFDISEKFHDGNGNRNRDYWYREEMGMGMVIWEWERMGTETVFPAHLYSGTISRCDPKLQPFL